MKKLFQTNYLLALLFIVGPLFTFAQEDGNTFRDIEPPLGKIDDFVISFAFVAILSMESTNY